VEDSSGQGDEHSPILQHLLIEEEIGRGNQVDCLTPPIFIKLRLGLSNNKFSEQQFFQVSEEWECPEGTVLRNDQRMSRVWKKLGLERCEAPEISISERADVQEMTDWSMAKLKAENFDDINFDHIVTDEAMRPFLRYTIPPNKKMMTKRRKGKKKGDASHQAPKSPRQPAKKKAADTEAVALKKKKQTPPLATSVPRRAPPMRMAKCPIEEISQGLVPEVNTEEGSMSFEWFILECSLTREPIVLPTFSLVDEFDSEGPSSPLRSNNDEVNFGNTKAASPTPETVINEGDPLSEAGTNELAWPRVKHLSKRRKFGPRDRLAGIISEAE
jgi:hypothetical protein